MLDFLQQVDTNIFLLINQANNGYLDSLMVFISSKYSWIILYLVLIILISIKYKRSAIIAVAFVILAVGLADLSSVHLFKNVFQRLRPCYEPALADIISNIVGCGGKYGFVSSHAANSFAIVIMVMKLIGDKYKSLNYIMPLWGILILYSRIYLGKHYPADVIFGAILGGLIASLMFWLFNKTIKYISNNTNNNWASFFHTQ